MKKENKINQNITKDENNEGLIENQSIKRDIVFKVFFGKKDNQKYIKSLLEAILKKPIEIIEISTEASLQQLAVEQRAGRLDIKARMNMDGEEKIVNIEMQMQDYHNIEQRSVYYGSRLIAGQLKKTEKFKTLKPVIMINILDYNCLEVPEYCTETVTVAKNHREYEVIKDVKYYFIELPKFREAQPDLNDMLASWLTLIDYKDGGRIKMAEEKHEIIKDAKKDLKSMFSDKILKEIEEFNESAEHEKAEIRGAAMEEGERKGERNGKIEIAKKMISKKISVEEISEITGLTKEEIENL